MYHIIGGDGKQYGPISTDEVRQWITEGRLNAQSMAKTEAETEFRALSTFPEFAYMFSPRGSAALTPGPTGSGDAAQAVKIPAIALIVVASLGIAYYLFNTVLVATGKSSFQPDTSNLSPQMQQFMEGFNRGSHGPLAIMVSLFVVALNSFVLFGSIKMLRLQNYGVAVAAAIVAMLPCQCCCLFGLPFGIWALVVLNKPEVKSQFE